MYLHKHTPRLGEGREESSPDTHSNISLDSCDASGGVPHISCTRKPKCSVVTAPEFQWEPLSRCKYCAVRFLSVCEYASKPRTHLSNVALWPRSKAMEGEARSLWKPSSVLATFILLFYSKERDFSFVLPAKRYLRVCMCACDRERAGGRELVDNMTKAMKWPKQAENQSINQSRGLSCLLTRCVLAGFLNVDNQKASKAEPLA